MQMISGCQSYGSSFICGDDIMVAVYVIGYVGTYVLEQTVGNPGKEIDAVVFECLYEKCR